jgi:hypothetical protein
VKVSGLQIKHRLRGTCVEIFGEYVLDANRAVRRALDLGSIHFRKFCGAMLNAFGVPAFIRDCDHQGIVHIRLRRSVGDGANVNGVDISFDRLTGRIRHGRLLQSGGLCTVPYGCWEDSDCRIYVALDGGRS